MIGGLATRIVFAAARWRRVPGFSDRRAAHLTTVAIRFYRRCLSRWSGRTCLFHPTCSQRAIGLLNEHGFRIGMEMAGAQLRRCGGEITIFRTATGVTVLATSDGVQFGEEEIAPAVRIGIPPPPG